MGKGKVKIDPSPFEIGFKGDLLLWTVLEGSGGAYELPSTPIASSRKMDFFDGWER